MKKALHFALAAALIALTPVANATPPTPDQINLDVGSPPAIIVHHALTQRYSKLVRFYEAGVIGLDKDGMVKMHDDTKLKNNYTLRKIAEKLIDQDNPDRQSLIFAIADAHGGKEAMPAVKEKLIKRWRDQFKPGWWLEDDNGQWYQKH